MADSTPKVGEIVVGIDGSTHAQSALQWAIDRARRNNAPLRVVVVWAYPYFGDVPIGLSETTPDIESARELLRRTLEQVHSA